MKDTRGGPRPNSGRKEGSKNKTPAKGPHRYALRLSEGARAWIEAEATKAGLKPTPFLERLIEQTAKQKEGEE